MQSTMVLALALFVTLVHAASATAAPNVTGYWSVVDSASLKVTFNVAFDGPPDFSTVLGPNSFPQVLQFDVDPDATLPGSGVSQTVPMSERNFGVLACDAEVATCQNHTYTVYDSHNNFIGGVGFVPFSVNGNVFSLTISLALLNDSDGFFTYAIEDGAPGTTVRHSVAPPRSGVVDGFYQHGYYGLVKRATISQTKNQLSALLERVKRGEEVLILERQTPIARIVPIEQVGRRDMASMLVELERKGIVRAARRKADSELTRKLGPPPKPRSGADIVAALRADREESR